LEAVEVKLNQWLTTRQHLLLLLLLLLLLCFLGITPCSSTA
jgi:hypothetical protein